MRSIEVPDDVAIGFESASPDRREAAFASLAGWLRSDGPSISELLRRSASSRSGGDSTDVEAMETVLAEVAAHRSGH